MKKFLIVFAACFIGSLTSFGQDNSSDILYVKAKNIDKSYSGKFAHLVFANLGNGLGDTVILMVMGKPVAFLSRKLANPQGNLFYGQYLESAGYVNGLTVRLVKSRIDEVGGNYIQLTNFFDFYGKGNALAAGKSIQESYRVAKKQVDQLLIKQDKTDM